jgi:hypothetical protein
LIFHLFLQLGGIQFSSRIDRTREMRLTGQGLLAWSIWQEKSSASFPIQHFPANSWRPEVPTPPQGAASPIHLPWYGTPHFFRTADKGRPDTAVFA